MTPTAGFIIVSLSILHFGLQVLLPPLLLPHGFQVMNNLILCSWQSAIIYELGVPVYASMYFISAECKKLKICLFVLKVGLNVFRVKWHHMRIKAFIEGHTSSTPVSTLQEQFHSLMCSELLSGGHQKGCLWFTVSSPWQHAEKGSWLAAHPYPGGEKTNRLSIQCASGHLSLSWP